MANLDCSELMTDPDFVDDISIITRFTQVNYLGENIIKETEQFTVGSVQPASYVEIQKLPEAMRVADVSSFWVKGDLIVASNPGEYPSILVFKGRRYQVQKIADWSNFGQGYQSGTCIVERPAP